jgi:hypothetical protein
MNWTGHAAYMGEIRIKFLLESLKGRDQLKELGVDGEHYRLLK